MLYFYRCKIRQFAKLNKRLINRSDRKKQSEHFVFKKIMVYLINGGKVRNVLLKSTAKVLLILNILFKGG